MEASSLDPKYRPRRTRVITRGPREGAGQPQTLRAATPSGLKETRTTVRSGGKVRRSVSFDPEGHHEQLVSKEQARVRAETSARKANAKAAVKKKQKLVSGLNKSQVTPSPKARGRT